MYHPNELDQQIDNLRTLQGSYDQIATAAEAYNVGKTQLAQAITAKGVETSPTESYPEMAEKVNAISQETYEINGGEMYAKQLFGDSSLWNLYEVLAQMKTQFMGTGDYAALIVCEYYKGYDSLVLQGADGYYTCDGDYYDYASPTHVWHDADNGKMNRWVAFLYRDEGARLDITNTSISPRSMYIGGHIGTIRYFINGRLTEFVCGVEETDVVDSLNFGAKDNEYTQSFAFRTTIKNVGEVTLGYALLRNGGFLKVDADKVIANGAYRPTSQYIDIKANIFRVSGAERIFVTDQSIIVEIFKVRGFKSFADHNTYGYLFEEEVKIIDFADIIQIPCEISNRSNTEDFIVGEMVSNIRFNSWNPTTILADTDKKAKLIDNIKNHILARVSDRTGLTQLVFTISTNMYNNIASEQIEWQGETMSLADAFLTKNWLLAGA